jgi:uncharacterized membrane protein
MLPYDEETFVRRRSEVGPMAEELESQERMRRLDELVAGVLCGQSTCDVNALEEERLTPGQRLADSVAVVAGSWGFVGAFLGVIAVWMALNAVAAVHHWDSYPFDLLNLVLSCVAAVQASVILMSQNRQGRRDRLQADSEYEVNVKAEILLEHLTLEIEDIKMVLTSLSEMQRGGAPSTTPPSRA